MNRLLLFLFTFGGRLNTGIGTSGKFALEFFNTTRRVDELQLACIERVAAGTNVDFNLATRASCCETRTTPAGYGCFHVIGMNAFFHDVRNFHLSLVFKVAIFQR